MLSAGKTYFNADDQYRWNDTPSWSIERSNLGTCHLNRWVPTRRCAAIGGAGFQCRWNRFVPQDSLPRFEGWCSHPNLKFPTDGIFLKTDGWKTDVWGVDGLKVVGFLVGDNWHLMEIYKCEVTMDHNGLLRYCCWTLSFEWNLLRIYAESHMEVKVCLQVSLNQAWDCHALKNESTICIFSWCSELYPTSAWSTMFVSFLFVSFCISS